jgi:signal transduction histidine kinase
MLRTQKLDQATTARALEVIERNTKLQGLFIEDLLDVSHILAGKLSLDVRPIMVAPAVEAALAAMQGTAEAKGVGLESTLDETAGPVRADPARLQQVVWNLVSNAIKFTPSGGRVEVRLGRRGPAVEVSVRDTGKGIEAKQLSQIFTTAVRRTAAGSLRKVWGSGLSSCAIWSSSKAGPFMPRARGPDAGQRSQ